MKIINSVGQYIPNILFKLEKTTILTNLKNPVYPVNECFFEKQYSSEDSWNYALLFNIRKSTSANIIVVKDG